MYKKWFLLYISGCLLTACSSSAFIMEKPLELEGKYVNLQMKERIPKGFFPVDLNIVAIGDSLTEGVGDSSKKGGYVPYVVQFLSKQRAVDNVLVSNLGKRGSRTDQLLQRLNQEEIITQVTHADIIFMTIGGNDMIKVVRDFFYNISLETFQREQTRYEKRLNKVLGRIRTLNPDAHIYLIGFYNPFLHSLGSLKEINTVVQQWNETSKRIALRFGGVTYVKVDDLFQIEEGKLLAKDQFHPNEKGYELIAQRIKEYVENEQVVTNPPDSAMPAAKE